MIRTRVQPLKDGFSMLIVSPRLALCYRALKRPGKGGRKDRIQCGYFGFESEAEANTFANYLRSAYPNVRAVVREGDRLPECGWEVKVWEFAQLLQVVQQCAAKAAKAA